MSSAPPSTCIECGHTNPATCSTCKPNGLVCVWCEARGPIPTEPVEGPPAEPPPE